MRSTTISAAILSTAALSFSALPGCEEQGQSWTAAALPARSDRLPVFVKLKDGSLLAVIQKEQNIFFYKNATGYGEGGVRADAVVAGASVDFATANTFREIRHLEALAFVNNDWRKIYDACEKQAAFAENSIEPNVVKFWLEMLVEGVPHTDLQGKPTVIQVTPPELFPELYPEEAGLPFEMSLDPSKLYDPFGLSPTTHTMKFISEVNKAMVEEQEWMDLDPMIDFTPVYIALEDGSLLRISQASRRASDRAPERISFHRTFPGYGVQGVSGHVLGVGGGGERPVSHIYKEISPFEALAYFDGDPEKILAHVERQDRVIILSVEPDVVRKVFTRG